MTNRHLMETQNFIWLQLILGQKPCLCWVLDHEIPLPKLIYWTLTLLLTQLRLSYKSGHPTKTICSCIQSRISEFLKIFWDNWIFESFCVFKESVLMSMFFLGPLLGCKNIFFVVLKSVFVHFHYFKKCAILMKEICTKHL